MIFLLLIVLALPSVLSARSGQTRGSLVWSLVFWGICVLLALTVGYPESG